ncbi:MAG: sigma-70 family RNA polymerase sigma factor [Bacteroidota bacterium]
MLTGLRAGDEKAYRALIDTYKDRVYNVCLGYVYNAEDAEDLAQEVFLEVFRSIGNFKGESCLYTWVYRICVTKSLELIRRRKRKKRSGKVYSLLGMKEMGYEPAAARFDHPGVRLENQERATILFGAIESLSDNQRIAFSMHNLEGKSYAEISDLMGVSLSSVESLIFRAKRNLRKKLEHYYRNQG